MTTGQPPALTILYMHSALVAHLAVTLQYAVRTPLGVDRKNLSITLD